MGGVPEEVKTVLQDGPFSSKVVDGFQVTCVYVEPFIKWKLRSRVKHRAAGSAELTGLEDDFSLIFLFEGVIFQVPAVFCLWGSGVYIPVFSAGDP